MNAWYYMKNGVQTGPVTTEEVQSLLTSGAISGSTLVWRDGLAGWAAASAQVEFAASVPAAPPPPPPTGAVASTLSDAEQNKVFGILAYLGLLVLVPILAAKESAFARYHSNQGLVLLIAWICSWIALWIVDLGLFWVPVVGWALIMLLNVGLWLGGLALAIIGIINAAKGECKPLPLIGKFTLIK